MRGLDPRDSGNRAASGAFYLHGQLKAWCLTADKTGNMSLRASDPPSELGLRDVLGAQIFCECHHAF
jgi:hypothetical protein